MCQSVLPCNELICASFQIISFICARVHASLNNAANLKQGNQKKRF